MMKILLLAVSGLLLPLSIAAGTIAVDGVPGLAPVRADTTSDGARPLTFAARPRVTE